MGIEKLSGAQLYDAYAQEFRKKTDNSNYATKGTTTVTIVEKKKDLDKGVSIQHSASNLSPKAAKENQKNYEKNKEHIENSNSTVTYIDKKAYKAAEKERKNTEKELVKKYRAEGHSKKEAKQMAKNEVEQNRYIGNKNTKKFINTNQELFYDENGNYSADKARKFARDCANISTDKDENGNLLEVENGYLSLKERRNAAAKYGVKDDVIADIAKNTGHGYEKDNTGLYRAAYVTGMTATGGLLGFGLGKLTKAKATAIADAEAVVKDAAGNIIASGTNTATAVASTTAAVPGAIIGAGLGLGAGLLTMKKIKDNGGTEPKIYDPNPTPPQTTPDPQPEPVQPVNPQPDIDPEPEITPEPEKCILKPDELLEETCVYTLKKGQSLYDAVRDGYKLKDHKQIMKFVHEIKDRHGVKYTDNTPRTKWDMPEIEGRKFNCDVNVKGTVKKYGKSSGSQGEFTRNDQFWYEDCDNNRSNIFTNRAERDAEMAKKQAEIDAK